MKRYSITDVHRAYPNDKALDERHNQWPIYYLFRRLSFYITPFFLNIGLSATAVTLVSLSIALVMPLAAILDQPWHGAYWVAVLGFIFVILDCVDGDMARTAGRSSALGAYLDFIVDIIYRLMFYLALGILVERQAAEGTFLFGHGVPMALFAVVAALMARASRLYRERESGRIETHAQSNTGKYSLPDRIFSFFSGIDYLFPLFLLIAYPVGGLNYLLLGIVVYSLLDFSTTQFSILKHLIKIPVSQS
uniref:Phosphatidylglycerophosphate synthase n=1 Tax=Candidatus Kentrum sp. FW TaxID=2126338 RepID=A0A450TDC3_9GAMM|nr:MAG: Phosphatidylglycerophosphate synthase [Candidatus Kentron sp. FW]